MAVEDPRELEGVDREIRINELKRQAEEIAGGEMASFEAEDAPSEVVEQFWRHVVEYERAPLTTHFEQLTRGGLELPSPEAMDDDQLSAKLAELIQALAQMRCFLYSTDHLSDRGLYARLWTDTLHEETADLPASPGSAWHIDLVSSGSMEDVQVFLRYYADEEDRRRWAAEWPDDPMPDCEPPPYNRHLPRP